MSIAIAGIGSARASTLIETAVNAAIARTLDAVAQGGAPAVPSSARGHDPAPLDPPVIAAITVRG